MKEHPIVPNQSNETEKPNAILERDSAGGLARFGEGIIDADLVDQSTIDEYFVAFAEGKTPDGVGLAEILGESIMDAMRRVRDVHLEIDAHKGVLTVAVPLMGKNGRKPVMMAIMFPASPEAMQRYAARQDERRTQEEEQRAREEKEMEIEREAASRLVRFIQDQRNGEILKDDEEYPLDPNLPQEVRESLDALLHQKVIQDWQAGKTLLFLAVRESYGELCFVLRDPHTKSLEDLIQKRLTHL